MSDANVPDNSSHVLNVMQSNKVNENLVIMLTRSTGVPVNYLPLGTEPVFDPESRTIWPVSPNTPVAANRSETLKVFLAANSAGDYRPGPITAKANYDSLLSVINLLTHHNKYIK